MNKKIGEKYLKIYIDSNADEDIINNYINEENITIEEYKQKLNEYLDHIKKDKKINKLYLEYCLKYKNKENKTINKRKEAEIMINIISNYIKEDKHNIKDYISNYNVTYTNFKKFINNYKKYYLKDVEKNILKKFLKRENDFNKDMLDKVKIIVDKMGDDLVNDKPFDIIDYYLTLGWDSKLLIYFLNNNKEHFSNFVIDNVKIYLEKYHMNDKKLKLNEFISIIKKENKEMSMKDIEKIINYMNEYKMPYNYYLFETVKKNINSKKSE